MTTNTDFEVIHSRLDCDLCGEDDYCILAETASPVAYMRQHICSACVELMSRLYDQLERDYPSYELRRSEASHQLSCANCRKGMNDPHKSYAYGPYKGDVWLCSEECNEAWRNRLEGPAMFGLVTGEHDAP